MPASRVTRDIRYGPADRNLLDIFTADGASGMRPVLIFVHGGGFVGGNKSTPGSPFYDNVPLWAARNGLVGVNITYRLAPQAPWPAGAEDVGLAVRWVVDNIARFGGDPSRIFLFGHSAGATHAGSYAAMPQFHGGRGIGIAGLILTSGIYDLTDFPLTDNHKSLYRQRRVTLCGTLADRRIAHTCGARAGRRCGTRSAAFHPSNSTGWSTAMAQAPGGKPRRLMLKGHSHLSLGYAIGTDDTALTGPILEFVSSVEIAAVTGSAPSRRRRSGPR